MTGRLKLREQSPGTAELIAYARADRPGARVSSYRVVPAFDPVALGEALADALGVRAVVEKCRRLLLWRGVRIHLDDVVGLGTWVELEAVMPAAGEREVTELRRILGIADERIAARGYAELLGAPG